MYIKVALLAAVLACFASQGGNHRLDLRFENLNFSPLSFCYVEVRNCDSELQIHQRGAFRS